MTYGRQQELLKSGWTARARYDEAEQALRSAQAQVDSARADLRLAEDRLGYTVLLADGPGVVTSVGAEPARSFAPARSWPRSRGMAVDAVFDAPEQLVRTGPRNPVVEIALSDDPRIKATGHS